MRIRAATGEDLVFLRTWAPVSAWESLSAEERPGVGVDRLRSYAESMLQSVFSPDAAPVSLIAEVSGAPVGYALCTYGPDSSTGLPQALLHDLFVVPQMRRQGIARSLQQAILQQCATAGLRKVKIWTGIHNLTALHMAARSGFKAEGLIGVKVW